MVIFKKFEKYGLGQKLPRGKMYGKAKRGFCSTVFSLLLFFSSQFSQTALRNKFISSFMHKVLSYLQHIAHFNKTKNKGGVIPQNNN